MARRRRDKPCATGPAELAAARAAAVALVRRSTAAAYATITTFDQLDAIIAAAFEAGAIAIDTETSSLDPMQAELIGISLCVAPGRACYIPLRHRGEGAGDLFGGDELAAGQLPAQDVLARLKPLLESDSVLKIAHNAKFDMLVFKQHGIAVRPIDDTLLLSYVLDAGLTDHGMDVLSEKHLNHKPLAFGEVAGSGRTFIGFARVPIDKATEYSAEDADVTLRLWNVLEAAPAGRAHDQCL